MRLAYVAVGMVAAVLIALLALFVQGSVFPAEPGHPNAPQPGVAGATTQPGSPSAQTSSP
jgi:hypothetical protein